MVKQKNMHTHARTNVFKIREIKMEKKLLGSTKKKYSPDRISGVDLPLPKIGYWVSREASLTLVLIEGNISSSPSCSVQEDPPDDMPAIKRKLFNIF